MESSSTNLTDKQSFREVQVHVSLEIVVIQTRIAAVLASEWLRFGVVSHVSLQGTLPEHATAPDYMYQSISTKL